MPLRDKKGLERAKAILKYTDSESNEMMVGLLHAFILPLAMCELGRPWMILQIAAFGAGLFQLYCVLYDGRLSMRLLAVQIATLISMVTIANFLLAGLMHGSHFLWLLIGVMTLWNLYRVTTERTIRNL